MSRGRYPGQAVGPYRYAGRVGMSSDFRVLRIEAGLTQAQLAELAGVSIRTVRTADCWGEPGQRTAQAIKSALGRRLSGRFWADDSVDRLRAECIELASKTGKGG